MAYLKLLLADDEILIRRRVRLLLDTCFEIHEAETAAAAESMFDDTYDCVLLDITFPDGNGIDLCEEMKAKLPYTTVLISSSMETVEAWNQAFAAGADGYVEKRELLSLDPRKIELMIRNLVERNCLRKRTENLNRRQAELLSVLSHDVRAPFQTLIGIIELLRKDVAAPAAARNVELLDRCVKDQLAFINSLLELLRLEAGSGHVRMNPVDLNLAVNQTLLGLSIIAEKKSVKLRLSLAVDLPKISGDLAKFLQLVNNLVTNAVKFTPRGGEVTIETLFLETNRGPGVELRISDTGVGIPDDMKARIFQRFGRGTFQGTEGEPGVGLGLSICREIVQLHSGSLWVADNTVGGTIFHVWMPLAGEIDAVGRSSCCADASSSVGAAC